MGRNSKRKPILTHLIPYRAIENSHQGSYKDIISRVHFFEKITNYRQIILEKDSPDPVLKAIEAKGSVHSVLIEYSHFPRTIRVIRRKHPKTFIAVRAHNIEPLQHLDNHGWRCRRPDWLAYGMLRLFLTDIYCKLYADIIYPISDYEMQLYWRRLPGRARVNWLPYYCPDYLINKSILKTNKRNIIACLPTSQKNRKSWDLVTRLVRLAEVANNSGNDLEFVLTGNLRDWGLPKSPHVKFVGMIDDLRTFLPSVRAVAVLSPLGYGFKTTICDAIANGCFVLVHPAIHDRLPDIFHNFIVPIDTKCLQDLDIKLQNLSITFPDASINKSLKELNHFILQQDFWC